MESQGGGREAAKGGDEHSTEQAATLLGSTGADAQSTRAERQKRRKSNNCKIITGVLLLFLLMVILAVVFALKQRSNVEVTSCKSRCTSERKDQSATCHCDITCLKEGDCCQDYQDVCVAPMRLWACTSLRCGEERLAGSQCSCSDDCIGTGDCCSNYNNICKGEKNWVEEGCEDMETPQCPAGFPKPPVILVSMDGFRAGYLSAYGNLLPVISKLRNCGTTTPYMRPAYPTKTFPNHYTIVTGLYPESHGIVDNKMYDVTRNASFSLKLAEKFNAQWYQGEPVWITAMRHKQRSATFFWPGSDVAIEGLYPDHYKVYNRVTTIFEWLDLPEGKRPDFYTLYLEEPDATGHRDGPMSPMVLKALQNVDGILGMLMDGLKQRNLHRCANLVVLSDHGMEEATCTKAAYVSTYQDNVADFIVIQGPAARIRPKKLPEEFFTFDYEGLVKNLSCRIPDQPMRPFLKEHLPKRLHFANNVRIERAHLYMKRQWQAALNQEEIKYCSGGFHGSDNLFTNMQTVFMGYGPGINTKTVVPPFENIEIYNLLCDLLGVPPAPNNGTHGSLNHVLRRPAYSPAFPAEQSPASPCLATAPTVTDTLGCSCSSLSKEQEEKLNQQLIGFSSNSALKPVHLPYGVPRVLQKNAQFCVLRHADYINGYSKDILMPLWVAYTISPLGEVGALRPDSRACVRADPRVPAAASQMCSSYGRDSPLSLSLLHPPNLGSNDTESDSLLTSNMVPMFPIFRDAWTHIHDVLLVKYSQERNGVNVERSPVPTHYFLVLTSCRNGSSPPQECEGPLEVVSYVLPHRADTTETCANGSQFHWVEEWMQFHTARIRDVELLTGLSFYHDRVSIPQTLQLKTFLQTFIPDIAGRKESDVCFLFKHLSIKGLAGGRAGRWSFPHAASLPGVGEEKSVGLQLLKGCSFELRAAGGSERFRLTSHREKTPPLCSTLRFQDPAHTDTARSETCEKDSGPVSPREAPSTYRSNHRPKEPHAAVAMDLSVLEALERDTVLEVLQRDKVLRSLEEERIRKIKLELQDIRRRGAKSFARQYSERTCARCQRPLGKLWNCGAVCRGCSHRVCRKCRISVSAQEWKCTVCHAYREVKIKSGEWFLEERAKKFPGGADRHDTIGEKLLKSYQMLSNISIVPPTPPAEGLSFGRSAGLQTSRPFTISMENLFVSLKSHMKKISKSQNDVTMDQVLLTTDYGNIQKEERRSQSDTAINRPFGSNSRRSSGVAVRNSTLPDLFRRPRSEDEEGAGTGDACTDEDVSPGAEYREDKRGSISSLCAGMGIFDRNSSVTGEMELALGYSAETARLEVSVRACRNLAYGEPRRKKCHPYVKVYLLPDTSPNGKLKTAVKKNTTDPVFNEVLEFQIQRPLLAGRILQASVWHAGTLKRKVFLGEALLPLEGWRFEDNTAQNPRWHQLCPRATAGYTEPLFHAEPLFH
ncbi:hypothetical protein AAFF_G00088470 [Aldrovandia affinis]|uniref:Ectonucleotide pyrophosphatase/phosphodiesterase family member 3 n=1 Tax=Aldrovandia affinis TaxID=143900 RepID=A0AAD7RWI0_9TELE|nr:hypothetical protein AAFF_G00088470 [Aldrovandia affinis]